MGIINRYACAVGLDDDDHKTSLVPQEDQGAIMVNMSIAPGSTLEENKLIMAKIEKSWKVRQRSSIMPALPVMGLSPDKEPLTVRLSSD